MKLKKGDLVKIIKGKDKGKSGKIEKIFPALDKVLVEGVNQYKRHMKARSANQKSDIITITKPLNAASVSFVCPKCTKASRIGYAIVNAKKVRTCRRCKEVV